MMREMRKRGGTASAFESMLRICHRPAREEARQEALQDARDELEQRDEARTAELRSAASVFST